MAEDVVLCRLMATKEAWQLTRKDNRGPGVTLNNRGSTMVGLGSLAINSGEMALHGD